MRYLTPAAVVVASLACGAAVAKLPPLSEEAKAKAAETTARSAWTDKVGVYQLCQSMERVAATYRASAAGKSASAPEASPPCADPGPYVPQQITPAAAKPLEAAGAHSPPGTAVSPPSNKPTSAEMTGPRK